MTDLCFQIGTRVRTTGRYPAYGDVYGVGALRGQQVLYVRWDSGVMVTRLPEQLVIVTGGDS